ncbi:MAG: molybdopterin biosynthesis protein, partial [Deltaproteobacteria bacterium]|nr:molybdopterin biosynthesis protein [Deltaproteobacteria bacterium]
MTRRIYLKMKSLQEAVEIFLGHWDLSTMLSMEKIATTEAAGRVTAAPVFARFSVPTYHSAAMDGIALEAKRTFGAAPEKPIRLKLGVDAFWVNTGQCLPPGTNSVIMVEQLHQLDPDTVEIQAAAFPWQYVRKVGEDIVATELLLPQNHLITPAEVGAMLGAGVLEVAVKQIPRVLVIPTGDELVDVQHLEGVKAPPAGKVVEFNSWVLVHLLRQWGAICHRHEIVPDEPEQLRQAILHAVQGDYHIVVVNAGSSAGSEDHTANLIAELGEVLVHGVAIMPGKPTVLGEVNSVPVVGNPGYPVSAVISLEQFVRP